MNWPGFLFLFIATSHADPETFYQLLQTIDKELGELNAKSAEMAWQSATAPDEGLNQRIGKLNEFRAEWEKFSCDELDLASPELSAMERAAVLLCRGPFYTPADARELSQVLGSLRNIHQKSVVCLQDMCLHVEPELARVMRESRDPSTLEEVWLAWRDAVGPPSRDLYTQLVKIMNEGARRNGYDDIGQTWREELGIEGLESKMEEIFREVLPIYKALHAVVRFRLRKFYGPGIVPATGPLPAHLLGNMWGQSWSGIFDIVYGSERTINVTNELLQKSFNVTDLVSKSEEFYMSLGFAPMTKKFWKNSRWENLEGTCHGTSVNMFKEDDFRMLLCAAVTEEDLHVIYHEMGHIEYFMAYKNQPTVFKEGANSAMQESIGEAIAMAASTLPNLLRHGLVHDDGQKDIDFQLLLHFGLNLLPQLPFALVMEKWRWLVFRGDIKPENYNKSWWWLKLKYQGMVPPAKRAESHFDPVAKFHISDNVPYARYFIASILQVQLFEAMCKGAVFGNAKSHKAIPFPLHQCDIYGSKDASKTIREMLRLGASIDFNAAVYMVTNGSFSVQPFLNFFKPLQQWLNTQIELYKIPVGWH